MPTTKVTFRLDPETLACLRATAERLAVPKSAVVREAIQDLTVLIDALTGPRRSAPALRRAIEQGARLWTLNPSDFRDLPGLELHAAD